MQFLEWKDSYNIGVKEIDNQHRGLFDIISKLFTSQLYEPDGKYFFVGGSVATLAQILLLGPLVTRNTGKKIRLLAVQSNPEDLPSIIELVQAGKLTPMIDKVFPLREVPEAIRYLGDGFARGKLVITMDANNT